MPAQVVNVVEARAASYRMTKVGTSGYDSLPDWLAKANEAQLDLLNILRPHYGKITPVDEILSPMVQEGTATFTSGVLTFPSDFFSFVSMWKTVGEVTVKVPRIKTSMLGTIDQDTVRRPTVAKPKFYMRNSNFVLKPSNGDAGISMIYIKKPADVSITVTPVEDPTDDYETVTAQTDFIWPYSAKNLLIYLIVQRLGVELKEEILYELAQLGIKQNLMVEKPGK